MSSAPSEKWGDLALRTGSAVFLLGFGLVCVWLGGHVFHVLVAIICGVMVWELACMLMPRNRPLALQLGAFSGVSLLAASYMSPGFAMPLLLLPALIGFGQMVHYKAIFLSFAVMVLLSGFAVMAVRDDLGFGWMLWLALVVVVTDVVGYLAGKAIGGPKFWPSVSPRKTWSGTVAGWLGAALVGGVFMIATGESAQIIGFSVALSMAAQVGDICESAIKREMGVKDSSELIPGHGGLLDRFDGMMGAAVFLMIAGQIIGFPPEFG